jgi:DNA-binding response OmpR family regulator
MSDPASSPSPRVLVVDDDVVVTDTVRAYLERAGYAVDVERDGERAIARALRPDVSLVVLDWMLPGLSGAEACRRIRAESHVPIVMLTARTREDDRVRGFDSGADDYVPKPFSPRELVARVQALLRRTSVAGAGAAPPPIRVGDVEIDGFRREARAAGERLPLTPTEFRLLETLGSQPGRTFTREELIARACGPDYDGLDRAVDVHVTHLRRKIAACTARRHIRTVHGLGYRLEPGDGV